MSTMPMNGGYADYDLENQQLERRRRMAEMLAQQGMGEGPQGRMVGNQFVAPSWTQQLAHALNGPMAALEMRGVDRQQKELGQRKQADMTGETQRIAGLLTGTPGQSVVSDDQLAYGGSPADSTTTQMPGAAPDTKAAIAAALSARSPMWQQWGMSQIVPKTPKWEKAELPNADGSKRVGYVDVNSTNPLSTFQAGGVAPVKQEYVNGQGVNPYSGEKKGAPIAPQAPAENPRSDLLVMGPDGKLTPNLALIGAKQSIAAAGKPSIQSTIINAGPKEFEKELGQLDAKQLDKLRANAEAANNSLATVQNLRDAVKQGVYSGGGANAKMAAANLINGMTGATPKALPGSQLFNAEASKLVLDHVKALGANPSNADREFIEKTVPMLATSPQARDQMINFIESKASKTLDVYKRADAYARKNHGLGGFDLFPQPSAAQGGDVQSRADAILQGK